MYVIMNNVTGLPLNFLVEADVDHVDLEYGNGEQIHKITLNALVADMPLEPVFCVMYEHVAQTLLTMGKVHQGDIFFKLDNSRTDRSQLSVKKVS